jgi:hypothetical protein
MIKVTMAILADYAGIAVGGKLNIMGIFDNLVTDSVPVVIPHIYLVIRIEGDIGETEKKFDASINLIDEDGKTILSLPGFLMLSPPPSGKLVTRHDQIFPLFNLKLDNYGSYEFKIFINNELRASVPLSVMHLDRPPQQISDN